MSSKLNLGGLRVMQGVLMTARIRKIRSLGQSKIDSCGILWSSLSGRRVIVQGEFDTHQVTVLIAMSTTLLLSHKVLAFFVSELFM